MSLFLCERDFLFLEGSTHWEGSDGAGIRGGFNLSPGICSSSVTLKIMNSLSSWVISGWSFVCFFFNSFRLFTFFFFFWAIRKGIEAKFSYLCLCWVPLIGKEKYTIEKGAENACVGFFRRGSSVCIYSNRDRRRQNWKDVLIKSFAYC